MSDRVFFDTNVFVDLFDGDSPEKQDRARVVAGEGRAESIVISTQVLAEFYVAVTRKLGKPMRESEAEAATRDLAALEVVEPDVAMVIRSLATARRERISLSDALIIEAALARNCRRLLTEDLQNGRVFASSLRIQNPFS
jgi:predicted nucleic acid-binding protein